MEMPLPEILDRFTIVKLKIERIGDPNLKYEFEELEKAIEEHKSKGLEVEQTWIEELYNINGQIWDLEHDIRKGKEGELGLEEVGRRAIDIRELNKKRVTIKNQVATETGKGFKDVKMNHASE